MRDRHRERDQMTQSVEMKQDTFYLGPTLSDELGQMDLGFGLFVHSKTRPNIFHRWMMRILLGWKWTDKNKKVEADDYEDILDL